MNYQRIYDSLITRAQTRSKPEGYTEQHHILPRCLGGADCLGNLAILTAREHYIAHAILAKLYGGGLWRAFYMMSNLSGKVNSKLYARAKAIIVPTLSGWKHTEETLRKFSEKHKGKTVSKEQRRKISETKKKAGISPEHRLKLTGWKHSEESRKKISERNKGRVVGEHARKIASITHKGKTISEETRIKLSISAKKRWNTKRLKEETL